jgi:hypothetical protein
MKIAWRIALMFFLLGVLTVLARSELDFVYRAF